MGTSRIQTTSRGESGGAFGRILGRFKRALWRREHTRGAFVAMARQALQRTRQPIGSAGDRTALRLQRVVLPDREVT